MEQTEYAELIAKAKETLITTPKATKLDKSEVEAVDAILVNELLAERSALADQIADLDARKKEIEDIIRDAIGKKEVLLVNGAKVATISRWRETSIQSAVVKENFPVEEYPELYKRVDKSRLTIH
jgi:predicted phage-related endonuclease